MSGGVLRLNSSESVIEPSESVGPIQLMAGTADIVLQNELGAKTPGSLTIERLDRQPGTAIRFHHDSIAGTLGGSGPSDSHIVIRDAPTQLNGILGPWALVHDGDSHGRDDFASYGVNGIRQLSLRDALRS